MDSSLLPFKKKSFVKDGLTAYVILYSNNSGIEIHNEVSGMPDVKGWLEKTGAKGKPGEIRITTRNDVIYCLASHIEGDRHSIRKAGSSVWSALKDLHVSVVYVSRYQIEAFAEGCLLASYNYDYLKKEKGNDVMLAMIDQSNCLDVPCEIANALNFSRFLCDTPANLMTPTMFTKYAKGYLADCKNVIIKEYDEEYIKENKMGLFLSVARGSEQPPKLLKIRYSGGDENVDVCLVGKGVTFDSGGINLKSSASMDAMKMDMTGAASVLATIGLASRMKLKITVEGIIPLTENLPSGGASKPGDVFFSMNGTSVEVTNTDAEGRLILADAMLFAQKSKPKYLVDIATLTGAMLVALGPIYSGVFSNDNELFDYIKESGDESGDLVWRMPLDRRYKECMKSCVADIRNTGTKKGGSCTAAIFLSEFVESGTKWAHIDIANTMNESFFSELFGSGSTGGPVRLLFRLLERLSLRSR